MQRWLANTYLGRLYRFNKILFFIALIFFGGTVCCNLLKIEVTPFKLWGLFSAKQEVQDKYQVIQVVINDTTLLDYSKSYLPANHFFLISPLTFYVNMKQHNNMDPLMRNPPRKLKLYFPKLMTILEKSGSSSLQYNSFLKWYVRYIESSKHIPVKKLDINILQVRFSQNGKVQVISTQPLTTFKM